MTSLCFYIYLFLKKSNITKNTNIPRLNFAHLPTRIEDLPRLTKHLDGPQILVKRDDQTGLAFGGNKTRKLEFLVAEALEHSSDTLITGGALQSNHCRQTAALAAKFGLGCTLVLCGDSNSGPSGNLLLDKMFGAEIITIADRNFRDQALQETYDKAVKGGKKPYLVPYGGSNATGVMGYLFAMKEFIEQNIHADWFVIPTSSGGTHAGLVLGQHNFGYKGKILGISIDESEDWVMMKVSKLASDASEKIGERIEFKPQTILANADYCKAGYGVLTGAEREVIQLFARLEGLILDPVYTGRAAAGMIDLIRKGFFKKDETVLFWHTGGQPALFAEQYKNKVF